MIPNFIRQITKGLSRHRFGLFITAMVTSLLMVQASALFNLPAQAHTAIAPVSAPTSRQLQAGPSVEWARWILDLDFSKHDFATWRLVTGYDDNTVSPVQPTVLRELVKDITANCRMHGTAHVNNGEAVFDGTGYLECDLPSFVGELATLQTGLPLTGDCRCIEPDPFIYADLTLDRQLIGNSNPLFYEDSFRFHVPWVGKRTAASRWWLDGQSVPDHTWKVDRSGNALFSGVGAQYLMAGQTSGPPMNQPGLAATILATPIHDFLQWADTGLTTHFGWNGVFQMTTEETTVYIGYDPNTNEYLKARVRQLVVDPPCKSN